MPFICALGATSLATDSDQEPEGTANTTSGRLKDFNGGQALRIGALVVSVAPIVM